MARNRGEENMRTLAAFALMAVVFWIGILPSGAFNKKQQEVQSVTIRTYDPDDTDNTKIPTAGPSIIWCGPVGSEHTCEPNETDFTSGYEVVVDQPMAKMQKVTYDSCGRSQVFFTVQNFEGGSSFTFLDNSTQKMVTVAGNFTVEEQ
jgi:hypothetical protein